MVKGPFEQLLPRAPHAVIIAPPPHAPLALESHTKTLSRRFYRALFAGLAANTKAALKAKRDAQALAPPCLPTARQLEDIRIAGLALAAMAKGRAGGR
jgi:hypothetical protein